MQAASKRAAQQSSHLLNWIELSRSALKQNIRSLARLAGDRILSVCVKSNAYGHGLDAVTRMLCDFTEIEYLTVHSLDEAAAARDAGWERRIMVLGPVASAQAEAVFVHDLEPVIFDAKALTKYGSLSNRLKRPLRTHLKLETGTGRQGITDKELPQFARIYKKYPYLKKPYGASMHFANIEDTTRHSFAEYQLDRFRRMVTLMSNLGIRPVLRHTASSAALILFDKTRFDLVRPGIAAYGHWPSKETYLSYRLLGGENDLFKPVMTWKTRVTQLKQLPADSFIGYGCTYRTTSPTKLAVIPVGYFDGYDRKLSNVSYVLIKGKRAPVRGRICMNLTMVDVSDISGVKVGDEVTLIGQDVKETLTVEQIAGWAGTINYEILARLQPSIPRLIIS